MTVKSIVPHSIIRNSAFCFICLTVVESESRHDFKTCKCNNLSVDGGKDYIKRSVRLFTHGINKLPTFMDLSQLS